MTKRIMHKPLVACYEPRIMIFSNYMHLHSKTIKGMMGPVEKDLGERRGEKSGPNPRLLALALAAIY